MGALIRCRYEKVNGDTEAAIVVDRRRLGSGAGGTGRMSRPIAQL